MTHSLAPIRNALSSQRVVRVLLVDDSALALSLERRMLATSPHIEVVGTAHNGREALKALNELRPDVVCTDYQMPVMDGLELVQNIMATAPCPILVVSTLVQSNSEPSNGVPSNGVPSNGVQGNGVQGNGVPTELAPLLEAGALDIFPKPNAMQDFETTARAFVEKIRVLAGVFVFSRRSVQEANPSLSSFPSPGVSRHSPRDIEYSKSAKLHQKESDAIRSSFFPSSLSNVRVIGVGASTGGPNVLHHILSQLPAPFPCPILCIQHISAGFLDGLVEWLDGSCRLRVKVMEDGETAQAGTIYFPREGRHMTLDSYGRLRSSDAPPVDGHRPSVTALFQSLAKNYGNEVLAILLTGMGEDGARGLHQIYLAGGKTVAQDEASSVVFGMPRKAIELGAAQQILSCEAIAQLLRREFGRSVT